MTKREASRTAVGLLLAGYQRDEASMGTLLAGLGVADLVLVSASLAAHAGQALHVAEQDRMKPEDFLHALALALGAPGKSPDAW